MDDRCDDRDGGGDSFYYDYVFLGELVREQMTQQTGAHHGVLQALSEDGSELGTLGATLVVITVTGHPHTWCSHLGDSSARCPCSALCPRVLLSPPLGAGPNFLGPPLQVPQHGAPLVLSTKLQLLPQEVVGWAWHACESTYTHACSLAPSQAHVLPN